MATRTSHVQSNVGAGSEGMLGAALLVDDGRRMGPRLTSKQVRDALAKASFAILSYVTPFGGATFERRRLHDHRWAFVRGGRTR
jgi:hypothetical protein